MADEISLFEAIDTQRQYDISGLTQSQTNSLHGCCRPPSRRRRAGSGKDGASSSFETRRIGAKSGTFTEQGQNL